MLVKQENYMIIWQTRGATRERKYEDNDSKDYLASLQYSRARTQGSIKTFLAEILKCFNIVY